MLIDIKRHYSAGHVLDFHQFPYSLRLKFY